MLCKFSWVVGLLVNRHDRHWLRGSTSCDKLWSSDGGLLQVESVASGCQIDLNVVKNQDITQTVSVNVKVHQRCPSIDVEAWTFSVSSDEAVETVFQPTGFGRFTNSSFEEPFPSMQFSGAKYSNGCIYLGVHDGRAFPKKFKFEDSLVSTHFLASTEIDQYTSLPFKISVIDGPCSWQTLADEYVPFARNTDWFIAGLERREQRPDFVSDTPLWINTHWQEIDVLEKSGGSPKVVLERVKKFQDLIGSDIPLLLHWYEWDLLGYTDDKYEDCPSGKVCGFDSHYPEYFPAREGFTEAVGSLANSNVITIPYINGRIYDESLESWTSQSAPQAAACRGKSGQIHTEEYGNGVKFAPMCPATTFWQQSVADFAQGVAETAPVGGIYIDQIAAAQPVHCHSEGHSHVPGGGSSWTSGYVAMLEQVRSQMGQGKMIVTESNVEQYIGSVDTFLTLVAYSDLDTAVPAFQYVYPGGVFVTAGAEFFTKDITEENGIVFIRKIMKQFLFGSQLGWFSLGGRDNQSPYMGILEALADPGNKPCLDALVDLVRLRMDPVIAGFFKYGAPVSEINGSSIMWSDGKGALVLICNPSEDMFVDYVRMDLSDFLDVPFVDVEEFVEGSWKVVTKGMKTSDIELSITVGVFKCGVISLRGGFANVFESIEVVTY